MEPSVDLELSDPGLESQPQIAGAAADGSTSDSQAASAVAPDAMNQVADALKTVIPDLLRQIAKNTANPPTAVIGP
jgi:hypothetical protein